VSETWNREKAYRAGNDPIGKDRSDGGQDVESDAGLTSPEWVSR